MSSVYLSSALWKNGGSDPDAIWHHRSDGSRVVGFGDRSTQGVLLGANFERAILTNEAFMAYVCDNAATRPFSQITLGKVVVMITKLGCVMCSNVSCCTIEM